MRKLLAIAAVALAAMLLVAAGGDDRRFDADLSGDEEVPAVETETTGEARFRANKAETQIRFTLKIRDADGILAVAGGHLHCGPEGENGPVVAFLAGAVPPNGFDGKVTVRATLTDASIFPTTCGSNIAEVLDAMRDGNVYVNIHSAANPAGEIRGQIDD